MKSLIIPLLLILLLFFSLCIGGFYNVNAEPFNFAAVGDWSDNIQTSNTARNIDSKNPEIVLGLGDYAYEENLVDIRLWWDRIEMIHDDELFIGALGNHDNDEKGDDGNIQDEDLYLKLFKHYQSTLIVFIPVWDY